MKGRKRQALMQKRREKLKKERETQDLAYRELVREAQAAAAKSRTMKRLPQPPSAMDVLMSLDLTRRIPSACNRPLEPSAPNTPVELSEDMAHREALAQLEAKRRKGMVAPLYNKGGYQYIGDAPAEVIRTLGRKV